MAVCLLGGQLSKLWEIIIYGKLWLKVKGESMKLIMYGLGHLKKVIWNNIGIMSFMKMK